MADAKIVIDGDSKGLVRALTQATNYMQKLADDADKGGKKMEGAMGRATIKIDLIKRALMSAGQAATAVVDKMESASKTQRESRLRVAEIGAGAGLTGSEIGILQRNIEAAPGPTTTEERIAFLENVTKAKGRRRVSMADLNDALLAYSAGGDVAFGRGGADVAERMKAGRPLMASMRSVFERRRAGAIGTMLTPEVSEKTTLEGWQRTTIMEGAKLGSAAELGRARLEAIKAGSPGMAGLAEGLNTITGGLSDRALSIQQDLRDDSRENLRLLAEIVDGQKIPRRVRPQIGAQGEGAK